MIVRCKRVLLLCCMFFCVRCGVREWEAVAAAAAGLKTSLLDLDKPGCFPAAARSVRRRRFAPRCFPKTQSPCHAAPLKLIFVQLTTNVCIEQQPTNSSSSQRARGKLELLTSLFSLRATSCRAPSSTTSPDKLTDLTAGIIRIT